MKYFIDTEFLEGEQDKTILGFKYGKTKPTIDLISIGIVSEDNREYYAISKEFNLKEAWNRYQDKKVILHDAECYIDKEYWIRDNVLLPIYKEYICGDLRNIFDFSYSTMRWLLNNYGKTNKEIADDIIKFTKRFVIKYKEIGYLDVKNNEYNKMTTDKLYNEITKIRTVPEFYGYYCDYDWVVFCWLFGSMINLPDGFPMYCNDLKQELDRIVNSLTSFELSKLVYPNCSNNVFEGLDTGLLTDRVKCLQYSENYPTQTNEHNALSDAEFNKKLYNFLNNLNK